MWEGGQGQGGPGVCLGADPAQVCWGRPWGRVADSLIGPLRTGERLSRLGEVETKQLSGTQTVQSGNNMEKTKAPSGLQGHVEGFSPAGWTLLGHDSVGNPRQAADLHGVPRGL